ncbi:Uncharacterised protein [Mycobacteroides abscessus subsp. massiliense]|nr:Uncharacterised protein [Mycobacteroides abscessus subsp. massiliense]
MQLGEPVQPGGLVLVLVHRDDGQLVTGAALQFGHGGQLICAGSAPVGPQIQHHLSPGKYRPHRNPHAAAFQRYPGQCRRARIGIRRRTRGQLRLTPQLRQGFGGISVSALAGCYLLLPLWSAPLLIVLLRQHDGNQRRDQHHPGDRPPAPGVESGHVTTRPAPAGARSPGPSPVAQPPPDPSGPGHRTDSPWLARRLHRRVCAHGTRGGRERSPGG